MKVKLKIRKLKTVDLIFSLLILSLISGCQSAAVSEMNPEMAEQIALDAAGVRESDAEDLTSNTDGSNYVVTFSNDKGSYELRISSDGEVLSYQFDGSGSDDEIEEESEEEQSESDPDSQPAASVRPSDVSDPPVPEGLPSAELRKRAAAHLGLISYEPGDFKMAPADGQNVRLDILVDNARSFTILMNGMTGEIYSTTEK